MMIRFSARVDFSFGALWRAVMGDRALNGHGLRGDLMVSALDSGSSAPGSNPGRGHCVVFLNKTLNCDCAPLSG